MAEAKDSPAAPPMQPVRDLDIPLQNFDSVALARLIEEVRNDGDSGIQPPTAYNRTYHRHNR